MKKIAISTLLVLGSLTATARVLSPQEAINRVETSCNKAKIGAMTQLSPELMRTIGDSDGAPAVYVFKTGGAALVVSADDVATPLLGYVDAVPADSDNLPPQLDWWLKEYARQIEYAKANEMKVVANLDSGRDEIAPLCNTKWDQSTPYNSMCPPSGYGISMTGCVATAMAQVMKYHNWPERGTGISTYQDSWGQTFSMDMDVAFDWANMTNTYDETATQEQQDAVALLMVACGYAAKMKFDIYESSSNYSNAINGLKTYLGYSKGMRLLYRDFLDLHEWYDIIYDNLVNYGPILYAGESYNSGHAFVLDGYSSNGYYHFNWGWSGAYDGYFALTDLKPSGTGIGGNLKGYNYNQNIISYIKPAEGGETDLDADNVEMSVLKPLVPKSSSDAEIRIKSTWKNLTGHDIKVDVAWKIQDVTGGAAQYVGIEQNADVKLEGGWNEISLLLKNISKDGDYLVSLVTRAAGDSNAEWMDSKAQKDLTNYFHVSLSEGVYTYSPGESMQYDLQNIELAGGALYDQHLFGVTFKATNNNDIGLARHYVVNCYDPINNQTYNDYDGCYVNLQPGESKNVVVSVKQWACYTDNVLELTLYENNTECEVAVLGPYTVVADKFSYDSFELSMSLEDSDNVDKNNIKYSYTIDLYEGVFSGEVGVGILPGDVDYGSQSGIIAYGPTDFVTFYNPEVFTGDNQPMHISKSGVMSFPEGVVNTSYYLLLYYTTYKDDFVARWMEPFTIGNYEDGVEDVVADSATPIVNYDRSTRRINVSGSSNITKVDVYTVAGAGLGVPVALDGVNASVDVSAVGGSIIIVRVVDASGNVTCHKFGI